MTIIDWFRKEQGRKQERCYIGRVMETKHPILFWTVFPVVWVNLLGFPLIGILAVGHLGAWGVLYFPIAFGFILWAGDWNTLMEHKPQRMWRDHLGPIASGVFGGPLVCAGVFGILWMFGMMMEGHAQYRTDLDRCQRQAATPYEYHQC